MKSFTGVVISAKMQKTIVVNVERRWKHPMYKKIIKKSKKYLVHDEYECQPGDRVVFVETKPISKQKCWKVVERIKESIKKNQTNSKKSRPRKK